MTCAKAVVRARLVLPSGRFYEGENSCAAPQRVCPRGSGEGYDKCATVCAQMGHAEERALAAATRDGVKDFMGACIEVYYHYVCANCQRMLDQLGITVVLR